MDNFPDGELHRIGIHHSNMLLALNANGRHDGCIVDRAEGDLQLARP